jgi:nickel superoxide dismutase
MKNTMKCSAIALLTLCMIIPLYAHCEIPCGIYGDSTRIELIREHVTTIEKSMKMIDELSKDKKPDYNQLVRWVNNKEEHANKIQDIATQYFMFQRIKPQDQKNESAYLKYSTMLEHMHKICVYAMKCKQGTDTINTENILVELDQFEELYFGKHEH